MCTALRRATGAEHKLGKNGGSVNVAMSPPGRQSSLEGEVAGPPLTLAKVAELVDALDLGSSGVTRESSSLSFRIRIAGHRTQW